MELQSQKTASPEYIEEIRTLARENFFFFARAILGMDRMTERFHKDIAEGLQAQHAIRRLWMLPRDHYKSTLISICYPIWLLLRNPEERILLAGDTATNAQGKLSKIRSLILECETLRAFFPEMIPENVRKTQWSDEAITLPRRGAHAEGSIETIGAGGAVVGRHFTRIILDDIIAKEAAESPTVMKSVITWADNVESLLVNPMEDTIDVVGTHWHHSDVYHHLQKHWKPEGPEFFYELKLGFFDGLDENNKVLFPELYGGVENAKKFAARMSMQNPYLFSCNYLNDPTVPEAEFDLADVQFYEWDKDRRHVMYQTLGSDVPRVIPLTQMAVVITCDPAYSKKVTASRGAIAVSAVAMTGECFVLETKVGRWGGQGLIRELIATALRYRGLSRVIGIEATGTQQAFIDDFSKVARRKKVYCPIDPLLPGGMKAKDARIRFNLQQFVGTKRLYLDPQMNDLLEELRKFPMSDEKDLLDALSYAAEHYWNRAWGFDKDADAKEEDVTKAREATKNKTTGY
jgi:hypothetical protein